MSARKGSHATKEDEAQIRAGLWEGYGDMSALINRLYFSLRDARAELRARSKVEMPAVLAGVISPSDGGIFRNGDGDYLVEPIGDETGELILVRADGTTATIRGEWETGWEA